MKSVFGNWWISYNPFAPCYYRMNEMFELLFSYGRGFLSRRNWWDRCKYWRENIFERTRIVDPIIKVYIKDMISILQQPLTNGKNPRKTQENPIWHTSNKIFHQFAFADYSMNMTQVIWRNRQPCNIFNTQKIKSTLHQSNFKGTEKFTSNTGHVVISLHVANGCSYACVTETCSSKRVNR